MTLWCVGSCIGKDRIPFAICLQLNIYYQLIMSFMYYVHWEEHQPQHRSLGDSDQILRVLFLIYNPQWPPQISRWGSLQFMSWLFQRYHSLCSSPWWSHQPVGHGLGCHVVLGQTHVVVSHKTSMRGNHGWPWYVLHEFGINACQWHRLIVYCRMYRFFLPEASFGLWVLSLTACVHVWVLT